MWRICTRPSHKDFNIWLPFNEAEVSARCLTLSTTTSPPTKQATAAPGANDANDGGKVSCTSEDKMCAALDAFLTDSVEGEPFKHDVILHSSLTSAVMDDNRTALEVVEPLEPPCKVIISRLRTWGRVIVQRMTCRYHNPLFSH
jgi:hypothetical protein